MIAERDLAQRGPGDFFGTRQSGLPTLRVGDLLRDHALMEEARREAVAWLGLIVDDLRVRALGRLGAELAEGLVSCEKPRPGCRGCSRP